MKWLAWSRPSGWTTRQERHCRLPEAESSRWESGMISGYREGDAGLSAAGRSVSSRFSTLTERDETMKGYIRK